MCCEEDSSSNPAGVDAERWCKPGGSRRGGERAGGAQTITQALVACRDGEQNAFSLLIDLVYDDLRRIAHRQLRRERPGLTLNTTGLVHEAYLKLVDHTQVEWQDRSHFFAVAARAMRQIIIDHAKKRSTTRHGGNVVHVDLDAAQIGVARQAEMLLALDEAVNRLASLTRV